MAEPRAHSAGQAHGPLDLARYLSETRRVSVSPVLITPLFLFYEGGLRIAGSEIQNAVEASLDRLFWYLGPPARFAHAFFLLLLVAAAYRVAAARRPVFRLFPPFLLECALLALLLGPLLALLTGSPVLAAGGAGSERPLAHALLASVGAGIYEEALFRLLLLGGVFVALWRACRLPRWTAFAAALLFSSAAFATYHYVGPYGEPFELGSFVFRSLAGILLGLVFAGRGLAVAVYLHAFYDVLYDLRVAASGI